MPKNTSPKQLNRNHLPWVNSWVFLATPRGMRDLSFSTKDQTRAPCIGSVESESLDHQGSPTLNFFKKSVLQKGCANLPLLTQEKAI